MVYFLLDNSNQIIFSSGLLYNGSVGEAALERYEFRWKFSHLSDEHLLAERFFPFTLESNRTSSRCRFWLKLWCALMNCSNRYWRYVLIFDICYCRLKDYLARNNGFVCLVLIGSLLLIYEGFTPKTPIIKILW